MKLSKGNIERYLPGLLTGMSVVGLIATTVLAVKATPKALEVINSLEQGSDLKRSEIVKQTWKCYIPAIATCTTTIGCIIGANVTNKRNQAAITGAYLAMNNAYKQYKDQIRHLIDSDEKADIKDFVPVQPTNVLTEECLFYEEHLGRMFTSTKEKVLLAEYHFNRNFALRGYGSLNDFYNFLGLDSVDGGDDIGWSYDVGDSFYGYSWVDFDHELTVTEDGLQCYNIRMPFPPTDDYLGYGDADYF